MRRPMTSVFSTVTALLVTVLAVGCGDQAERVEGPETRFEREAAYRQACVSRLIAERADDDLQTLESTLADLDPSSPVGELSLRTTQAAVEYARAYQSHAELRMAAYAYMDSAANHSQSSADSARYIDRAGAFTLRVPAEGTVEANAIDAYQSDLVLLLSDANHPCNWDFPF